MATQRDGVAELGRQPHGTAAAVAQPTEHRRGRRRRPVRRRRRPHGQASRHRPLVHRRGRHHRGTGGARATLPVDQRRPGGPKLVRVRAGTPLTVLNAELARLRPGHAEPRRHRRADDLRRARHRHPRHRRRLRLPTRTSRSTSSSACRSSEYLRGFEAVCAPLGGRPHWGKMHFRDAASLRPAYPHFDDFLAIRDEPDPTRTFANQYTDRVFD